MVPRFISLVFFQFIYIIFFSDTFKVTFPACIIEYKSAFGFWVHFSVITVVII